MKTLKIKVASKYKTNGWIYKDIKHQTVLENIESILDKNNVSNSIIYNDGKAYIECWFKRSATYTVAFLQDAKEFVLQRENQAPITCKTLTTLMLLLTDMINEEMDGGAE